MLQFISEKLKIKLLLSLGLVLFLSADLFLPGYYFLPAEANSKCKEEINKFECDKNHSFNIDIENNRILTDRPCRLGSFNNEFSGQKPSFVFSIKIFAKKAHDRSPPVKL
ncbi:MAG: hypothetical protein JW871_03310 [Endomicrobiales bacterium]|nr:hypothetical protein [Endomicrobiales bacterium]